MYSGHILVGEISGFVELWRIDPTSGLSLVDIFGSQGRVPERLNPEEIRFVNPKTSVRFRPHNIAFVSYL